MSSDFIQPLLKNPWRKRLLIDLFFGLLFAALDRYRAQAVPARVLGTLMTDGRALCCGERPSCRRVSPGSVFERRQGGTGRGGAGSTGSLERTSGKVQGTLSNGIVAAGVRAQAKARATEI